MPVFYPLNDSKDTFSYSPPLLEDTMTIFSVYSTSTETHVGDIFSMFSSVPYGLWAGILVCFMIFAFVSSVGRHLLRKSHSGVWMSVCTFLDQDTHQDYYPEDAKYFAILSTTVMCGLFFIMAFRGGCVSTDLVTIDPPLVVDSYDYIVENGIETGFSKITPEWEKFKNSPKGSLEQKMFQRSFQVSFSPQTFINLLGGLISQKKVIVGRPFIARLAAMANLAMDSWPMDCGTFVGADMHHSKKYSTVFVSNIKHKNSPLTIYGDTL